MDRNELKTRMIKSFTSPAINDKLALYLSLKGK